MIPAAYITAWRAKVPWATDVQVEQDLVVSRAIVEIYSDDMLADKLAFRGGTAIHKLVMDKPGRYSEDIDLVQVKEGPIGLVMDALRERLQPWLGKTKWKQGKGRVTFSFRFESENKPVVPMRLKVEINTREHHTVFGHVLRPFGLDTPWFKGFADVLTYSPEELFGTKMRALYQRKKGRDLFDLAEGFRRIADLDAAGVIECFRGYLAHEGLHVSRAEFEANLAAKIEDRMFADDVPPLLADGITHNPEHDSRVVLEALVSLLPGLPWKGPGPGPGAEG